MASKTTSAEGPIDAAKKIYVTRRQLGPLAGRFANEDILECNLRRQGYTIIAPEKLTLAQQIEEFQTAGTLIFAEGSALHLFGQIKRDGQKISVIQRRPSIPPLIANQLGRNVVFLNEIEDIFWPPHRADNLSISVLNFRSIQRSLGASGFVDERVDWIIPTDDDVQRSLYEGRDDEILVPNSDRNIWLRNMRKKRRLEKRRKQKNANL